MMQDGEYVSCQSLPIHRDPALSTGHGDLAPDAPSIEMVLTCRPPQSGPVMSAVLIAGHPTGHVLPHQRAPSFFSQLRRLIRRGGETGPNRFKKPSDWLRVVALGVILVDFALLCFANRFLGRNFEGYLPGIGPMLGGLLFAIIIMRLARPASYPDWIVIGALQAVMGSMVCVDEGLQSPVGFLLFCCLFFGLSLLRLWVGETIRPRRGAASLLAGGLTSLFFVAWLVTDRGLGLGAGPDIILAADLLVAGFTMVSFGLSLRSEKDPS